MPGKVLPQEERVGNGDNPIAAAYCFLDEI
jgi:hypothetical protein